MRQHRTTTYGRKITPDIVEEILSRLKTEKPEDIAPDYGISRVMVYYIQEGIKWKFITRKRLIPFEGGYIEIKVTYDPRNVSEDTITRAKEILSIQL